MLSLEMCVRRVLQIAIVLFPSASRPESLVPTVFHRASWEQQAQTPSPQGTPWEYFLRHPTLTGPLKSLDCAPSCSRKSHRVQPEDVDPSRQLAIAS